MPVIGKPVDQDDPEFCANFRAMQALVANLEAELGRAREERSERARRRNAEVGKLTVQQRLDLLLDEGAPWLEVAPLAARGMYEGEVHGAGSRSGIGVVMDKECVVYANDSTIKGGAYYPLGVKKMLRMQTIAMENRLPMVILADSGGAYLPLQSEVFPDADDFGRVFYNQALLSKMGIPQVTAVMGLCTAGGAYIPAMSDHVVHVNRSGAIFLGGPPLVKAATGEEVGAEELGGSEVHCRYSGVSDYYAEDEVEAIGIVREIVGMLPDHNRPRGPDREPRPPLYDPREIYGIVPRNLATPYDCREVIARLVDGSEFLEFKALYGPTLVCGGAYIHGYRVGVLVNNGVLFSDSALKAAHFIELCDRDGVPLVFLQNITGFIVGRDYERAGITKDGQKMVHAVATATVPKFTVIIGASFGAGNYAMCGRAFGPRFLWMWPNARIGVMSGEHIATVLTSIKNEQRLREGLPPLSVEEEIRAAVVAQAEYESSAYYSTANLWDDGVIDPAATRDVLGLALAVAWRAPRYPTERGHGVFRM